MVLKISIYTKTIHQTHSRQQCIPVVLKEKAINKSSHSENSFEQNTIYLNMFKIYFIKQKMYRKLNCFLECLNNILLSILKIIFLN